MHPVDRPRRSFVVAVAIAGATGLAVRILYVLLVASDAPPAGDGAYYHGLANALADGHGFVEPLALYDGRVVATAEHPPLYPLALAFVSLIGGTGELSHRLASCLLGASTVPLVGLAGRRLAGERAGLIAAGLAALYPMLVILDGTLYAESLYLLLLAAVLLVALEAARRPSAGAALLLGALIGLATLTRNEAVLLLGLLAPPALWSRGGGWRRMALATVALVVVVAPWSAYSSVRFDALVPIATNTGVTLAGANCDTTYGDEALGQWSFQCTSGAGGDGAERSATLTRRGLRYAADHSGRLPAVAMVRVLRTWDLYRPWDQGAFYGLVIDGRNIDMQRAGLVVLWVLLPLAAAGAFVLRRRRRELWIVAAPAIMVTLAAVLSSGSSRLRAAGELTVVLLAAVAVDAWFRRRRGSTDRQPADIEGRTAVA